MKEINIDGVELISLKPTEYIELKRKSCAVIGFDITLMDSYSTINMNKWPETTDEAVSIIRALYSQLDEKFENMKIELKRKDEILNAKKEALDRYFKLNFWKRLFTSPRKIMETLNIPGYYEHYL